jgi:hypothetical protein
MLEIRVAWQFGLHENQADVPTAGGVWFPDNEQSRCELGIIVEAGNAAFGEGTHWHEVRKA